jgi:hypothetical protein
MGGVIAFAIASALDVVTTWYGLTYTEAIERNPLMVGVAESLPAMTIMKMIGFFVVWGIIRLMPHHWRIPAWWLAAGITFGIVLNNMIVIGA